MSTGNAGSTSTYWFCPLYSFDCYSQSVALVEGIEIKRIPREFADYLFKQSYSNFFRTAPCETEWMASLPYQAKATRTNAKENMRIGFRENARATGLLVDLITALRLCHEGRLIAGPLIFAGIHGTKWSIGSTVSWTYVSNINFFQGEEPEYELRQADVIRVNNLLQDIRKWRQAAVLDTVNIALERFHSTYHGNIEDRIIDQMIAFESLYLGDFEELTYKLALRAAFLLGKNADGREVIFNDMKRAYRYRSRIVHGYTQVSREELRKIIYRTQEYLRQSIIRFLTLLSKGYSLKHMRKQLLDENTLKNGKLLALRE